MVAAGFKNLIVFRKGMDPDELPLDSFRYDMVICPSEPTVVETLVAFHEQVGPFDTLMMTAHDWTEPDRLKHSIELVATG